MARTHGCRETELPLTLYLGEEKRPWRMLRESIAILIGLPLLAYRYWRGYYAKLTLDGQLFTADDWGLSPGVNDGILRLARRGVVRRVSIMARDGFHRRGARRAAPGPGRRLGACIST